MEEEQGVIIFRATREDLWVDVMAEITRETNRTILAGLHITENGPGTFGLRGIRDLMRDFCHAFSVKLLHVHGARRLSGANIGGHPAPFFCEVMDNGQTRFGRLETGTK